MSTLGKRIRELRNIHGLSVEELGQLIGKSKWTIHKYEAGERDPSSDTIKSLAEIFSVSIDYLMETETNTTTPIKNDDILEYLNLPLDQIAKEHNIEVNGKVPSKDEIDSWIHVIHYLSSFSKEE